MNDVFLKRQLETGRVFLWGDVTEESVKGAIEHMRFVFFEKKINDIYLYVHSDGGELDCCCALVDEMMGLEEQGAIINTIAVGKAYSSGAIIVSLGTRRYATPLSTIMFHPVSLELPLDYISNQAVLTQFTQAYYLKVMTLVANRCGIKTKKKVQDFIESVKSGLWIDTQTAKKMKFIDDVWHYGWESEIGKKDNGRGIQQSLGE